MQNLSWSQVPPRVRVVCHERICPHRRCPCLEVTDLPDGLRVITFPDSNTGEPGADQRPSYTTFVGTPVARLRERQHHAIGHDWRTVYWPTRHAAIHGHEAVVGRLLGGKPIDDLGI